MTIDITQVDAFTDQPFGGNPAAVCILQTMPDARWMQAVASEMNLSETAFCVRRPDGAFDLRWFTPSVEVDLCGHATVASSHVIFEQGLLDASETARFHTRSGVLEARRDGAWITVDLPARPPEETSAPAGLIEAIGVEPHRIARYRDDMLVEFASEDDVRRLRPDFAALRRLALCVIATARGDGAPFHIVSRYFASPYGIDEDPVTGSAHCCLAPWWQPRLGDTFMAYQASARGGVINVRLDGDRVHLGGQAVTVMHARLSEPAAAGEL